MRLNQLGIPMSDKYLADSCWEEIKPAFVEAVDFIGRKVFADEVKESVQSIGHAIKNRERHHIKGKWLPRAIVGASDDKIIEALARLRGKILVPARELSPEEKLARLETAMREVLGDGQLRDLVLEHAFGADGFARGRR